MNDKESLLKELDTTAKQTRKYAWKNYIVAYIFAGIAVTGSITATILAALKDIPNGLTAAFASIPAAVLAINTTFHFERKAIWHWHKAKRFLGLIRKLRFEDAGVAEVSKNFTEVDLEAFEHWVSFGDISKR